jgi:dihydrofolate reductase
MRKVILSIMVSVDGFIEGPNKELDWHVFDEEMEEHMSTQVLNKVDGILLGRVAYQLMADYWPTATDSIAPQMNDLPKIVFSRTLEKTEWKNSRFVKEIANEISSMKQQPGKDLVLFGGAEIAQEFMRLGLIDEYQLIVNPIVLGSGKLLFKEGNDRKKLSLLNTKSFKCGNVLLFYRPA